jgi:hypothetical protein
MGEFIVLTVICTLIYSWGFRPAKAKCGHGIEVSSEQKPCAACDAERNLRRKVEEERLLNAEKEWQVQEKQAAEIRRRADINSKAVAFNCTFRDFITAIASAPPAV